MGYLWGAGGRFDANKYLKPGGGRQEVGEVEDGTGRRTCEKKNRKPFTVHLRVNICREEVNPPPTPKTHPDRVNKRKGRGGKGMKREERSRKKK